MSKTTDVRVRDLMDEVRVMMTTDAASCESTATTQYKANCVLAGMVIRARDAAASIALELLDANDERDEMADTVMVMLENAKDDYDPEDMPGVCSFCNERMGAMPLSDLGLSMHKTDCPLFKAQSYRAAAEKRVANE